MLSYKNLLAIAKKNYHKNLTKIGEIKRLALVLSKLILYFRYNDMI